MSKPPFINVKEAVYKWLNHSDKRFRDNGIIPEILKNNEHCLRVEFVCGQQLADVIVEKSEFTFYRYVFFQFLDMLNEIPQLNYSWYDEDETSIKEIIENLDKAIGFVIDYSENSLRE